MKTWKNKELLQAGWDKTRENFWFLVGVMLLSYVISFIGQIVQLGFIVDTFASFVLTGTFIAISRGQKIDFKNLFDGVSGAKILHYFLGVIVTTVFVVVGLALFVVPGIIVGVMLAFVAYILVDEKKDMNWKSWIFWEAIKKSFHMTKGMRFQIFLFLLILLGINILGFLAFVVGLLVTIPISGIAMAALYDKLRNVSAEIVVEPISNNP